MEVVEVAPDGDCLFHALALNEENGDGKALRREISAYLREHAVQQHDATQAALWLEEAEHLQGPRETHWGGHTAVVAFCAMRNKTILVHTKKPESTEVTEKEVTHTTCTGEGARPTIHLLYNGADHYQGLLPKSSSHDNYIPAWAGQCPPKYFTRAGQALSSPAKPASGGSNPNKRPAVQAPRFRPRAKPKAACARNGKRKAATDQDPAKPAAAAPRRLEHRRYRTKTTPPPELQDDVLTEISNARVLPAVNTKHPHRKLEDLVKDRDTSFLIFFGRAHNHLLPRPGPRRAAPPRVPDLAARRRP